MRKFSVGLLVVIAVSLALLGGAALAQNLAVTGLTSVPSAYNVDETVNRLRDSLQDQGLTVMATVNHAANAQNANLELPPTTLIIFGNPNLGTELMQSNQTVGIDLPQKYLVWEDETGQVQVAYNEPEYLVNRHNLQGVDQTINQVSTALSNFANSVGPAEDTGAAPAETGDTQAATPQALPATGGDQGWWPWLLFAAGILLLGAGFFLRRYSRSSASLLLVLAVPLLFGSVMAPRAVAQDDNGLVTVDSSYSVEETTTRLQGEIENRGLILLTTVDHAANAQGVGKELRPTRLIIFGNPQLGTQLMQNSRTIGIDLPQKYLVWEDAAGQVHVTYNDPQYLARRHNVQGPADVLETISNALSGIAQTALAQ